MQKVIETIATTKAASIGVTDPNGYHVMNLCLDTLLREHKAVSLCYSICYQWEKFLAV